MAPNLVDEADLPAVIAHLLSVAEADRQRPEVVTRVADFEIAIDEARATGRITRYTRQLEKSGTIIGHVYKREDIIRVMRGLLAAERKTASNTAA